MTQTLTSQYGQEPLTVDALVPTVALRDKLGWTHISTPDSEVEQSTREQIAKISKTHAGWTAELADQTVQAALWLHQENRLLYRWVMNGCH